MDDLSKTIRVGTVDLFGIVIPGMIVIAMCVIGFFVPLASIVVDISHAETTPIEMDTNELLLALFLLVIFSYVVGYILRLSSPDQLDRKSAINVIKGEYFKKELKSVPLTLRDYVPALKDRWHVFKKWYESTFVSWDEIKEWIKDDGWPFDPGDLTDKYPYNNFREYLKNRGHDDLAMVWATWEPCSSNKGSADSENKSEQKTSKKVASETKCQRSKSNVNRMKMLIRIYCPELSALIESKEAHIRLMAGTWAAFKFSQWPIWIALIILSTIIFAPQWVENSLLIQLTGHNYLAFMFININLLFVIFFGNQRIERLFHYRRVSELFHIVQSAHYAQEIRDKDENAKKAKK